MRDYKLGQNDVHIFSLGCIFAFLHKFMKNFIKKQDKFKCKLTEHGVFVFFIARSRGPIVSGLGTH